MTNKPTRCIRVVRSDAGFAVYPDWRCLVFPCLMGVIAFLIVSYSLVTSINHMPRWFAIGASMSLLLQIPLLGWMLIWHLVDTNYRRPIFVFDSAERLVKYRGNDHECRPDEFTKIVVEEFDAKMRSTDDDRMAARIRATLNDSRRPGEILLQSYDRSIVLSIGQELAENLDLPFEARDMKPSGQSS